MNMGLWIIFPDPRRYFNSLAARNLEVIITPLQIGRGPCKQQRRTRLKEPNHALFINLSRERKEIYGL